MSVFGDVKDIGSVAVIGVIGYFALKAFGALDSLNDAAAELGKGTADYLNQLANPPLVYGGSAIPTPQWWFGLQARESIRASAPEGSGVVWNEGATDSIILTDTQRSQLNEEFNNPTFIQNVISQGLSGSQVKSMYFQRAQEIAKGVTEDVGLSESEQQTIRDIFSAVYARVGYTPPSPEPSPPQASSGITPIPESLPGYVAPGQQPFENYSTGTPDYSQSSFQRGLWLKGLQSQYNPTPEDLRMTSYAISIGQPVFTTRFIGGGTWGIDVPAGFM